MLDIKTIRQDPAPIKQALNRRSPDLPHLIDQVLAHDEQRRHAETEKQLLQAKRKSASKQIGQLIAQGQDPQSAKLAVKTIGEKISELDHASEQAGEALHQLLLSIPNTPYPDCPVGTDENDNPEIRVWGTPPHITNPKDHVELAENLGLLNFEDASKIAGSGFAVFRGTGAKLERALINFLLDTQTKENGYQEVAVPYLVRRECMEGTGQLPKFEHDMYGLEAGTQFLAPTAEVPLTNLYRDTLLDQSQLPIKLTACTPCFRREAGSAGRDNRGLIRMHQFDKIELVQIVHPTESFQLLEQLTQHAESILQKLNLHYRTIELCTGDLGFSATKTYDIEVWAPGQGKFLEVSSCSNFGDYQARRMKLRYKDSEGNNQFCHTLNGSGTALPRLYVALLEQNQNPDGSINIPQALQPYLGTSIIQ